LTTGRIFAAHEGFSGIRQVALMCTSHLIRASLGSLKSKFRTASRSVQPLLQSSLLTDRQTDRQTTLLGW